MMLQMLAKHSTKAKHAPATPLAASAQQQAMIHVRVMEDDVCCPWRFAAGGALGFHGVHFIQKYRRLRAHPSAKGALPCKSRFQNLTLFCWAEALEAKFGAPPWEQF